MATSLRFEDRLEGASKFIPLKEMIALLLEENEICDIVEKTQNLPTNVTLMDAYKKKNVKARRIILDAVKDHIIFHVTENKNAYKMWESLAKIYHRATRTEKWCYERSFTS